MKVWDRPVRLLHWALMAAVAIATLSLWWWGGLHQPAGYAALVIVLLRLSWGAIGSRYARFAQFVRSPRATLAYLRLLRQGREPRYIGHNPLGGWMVVLLLACVLGLALSGWLYTTDCLWGDERVDNIHRALAWSLLGLVALHVTGVIRTGLRHGESLVRAMIEGSKRDPGADDVD